ncbi:MAG: phosphonate transport system substrate-binding protein [Motiliproteus sp.]|jgi:phosphonate transport system substrate-binding protein
MARPNNNMQWLKGFLLALVCLEALAAPVVAAEVTAEPPLILGVFPRRGAALTTDLFTPMAAYLSQQLERDVQLVTAKDFPSFWRGVTEQSYDIVHYNQYHYIISADSYQVIAHNKEFGRSDVAGALYVRKDSGITQVSQLRGRRVVFGGGKDAMMSYIVPRFLLLEAGLAKGSYEARFANSPPNALMALYFDQADASGAGDILIDLPVVKKNIDTSTVTHLAKTQPLLHLPWAVNRTMAAPLRDRIQRALVALETTVQGLKILKQAKMTGMGAAKDQDYDPHRQIVAKVLGPLRVAR